MAQIVSLISGKGGTGKTSLCAGIAACLARDGFRVLAIDLDVGLRNLDIALGMADEAALPFTAVMRGETPIEQATPHPSQSRLSLLTAPVREQIESIGLRPFGAMLRQAKGKFDWILLDAPAGLGRGFQLATAFADEAIVVTLADPASQRDAARATELLLARRVSTAAACPSSVSSVFAAVSVTGGVLAAASGRLLIDFTEQGAAKACHNLAGRLEGRRVPLMKLKK